MLSDSEIFNILGKSSADCAQLIAGVTEDPESHTPALALKDGARRAGIELEADGFERALLRYAAVETSPRIVSLPVQESVKVLMQNEFRYYTTMAGRDPLEFGSYLFVTGCKVISLRRFAAGPMDWEISGFPGSWLFKVGISDLARLFRFLSMRMGGFKPVFFMHVARRPKSRGLLLERSTAGLLSYSAIAGAATVYKRDRGRGLVSRSSSGCRQSPPGVAQPPLPRGRGIDREHGGSRSDCRVHGTQRTTEGGVQKRQAAIPNWRSHVAARSGDRLGTNTVGFRSLAA